MPRWELATLFLAGALALGSLILTQLLLACLHRQRLRRIERKSLELCAANASQTDPTKRVPITVVTGFLGSGKTTLVNRVLTADHGRRIVVIENELGSVSIDHALIDEARQKDAPHGVIVLKNGCMCCSGESPGSELERVLDKLLDMLKVESGTLAFDYVLIETSGLADVGPILQVLWRHEMANAPFFLDGVVAMVDAKHIMRHLRPTSAARALVRRRPEAEKQLALADRAVLNKVDLVSDAELDEVRAAVRATNATCGIIAARDADVPLEQLLDLNAFTSARWHGVLQDKEAVFAASHGATISCVCLTPFGGAGGPSGAEGGEGRGGGGGGGGGDGGGGGGGEKPELQPAQDREATATAAADLDLGLLQGWMQKLVNARQEDLLRVKGVLAVRDYAHRFVLHGIHAQLQGQFDRAWRDGEVRASSLVLIGHRLDAHELQKGFDACCVAPAPRIDPATTCGECDDEPPPDDGAAAAAGGDADATAPTGGLRRRT